MTHRILAACVALASILGAPAAGAQIADIRSLGRTSEDLAAGTLMQWPGSGFETVLSGRKLTATISDAFGDNYLNVEVDGVTHVLDLAQGTSTYTLYSGEAGDHHIRVTRRTGPLSGQTHLIDVRADGRIKAPAAPERRILAIGDSLVTGFGVEGPDQHCAFSHATQNHDLTFPALVARHFGSDLQTVAADGRGLVRNYSGAGTAMDELAWRAALGQPRPAPPEAFRPQVVIISLGVTDFTADTSPPGFAEAYDTLLRRIRTTWPETEVFATFGASLNGERYEAGKAAVRAAVERRQVAGDRRVQFIELAPPNEGRRYGCSWHPGIDAHRFMADQLQDAIRNRLAWTPGPARSLGARHGMRQEDSSPLRHRG
jgi:lysophospholipase L1-like esterase